MEDPWDMHACTLCNWPVAVNTNRNQINWLQMFRGVYSSNDSYVVTGVSLHLESRLRQYSASVNRDSPWADMALHPSSAGRRSFGVMQQQPVSQRHGVLFHASCWSLLEMAYSPNPVPHARLLELCWTIPTYPHGMSYNWSAVDEELSRRNPQRVPLLEPPYAWNPRLRITDTIRVDPLCRRGPDAILAECPQPPPPTTFVASAGADSPSRVVQEHGLSIAIHLNTRDFLNSRLALRGLTPVFHRQEFWTSRFEPGRERWWFFEARQGPFDKNRDYRSLYLRTGDSSLRFCASLGNRKRVVRFVERIQQLLS